MFTTKMNYDIKLPIMQMVRMLSVPLKSGIFTQKQQLPGVLQKAVMQKYLWSKSLKHICEEAEAADKRCF